MINTNRRKSHYRERMRALGWILTPLLPRYGIDVITAPSAYAMCPGLKKRRPWDRFARCFKRVWKRLPLIVRRTLLKHWRKWPGRLQIELSSFRLESMTAACGDEGYTLRFHPLWIPDKKLSVTIAHELAHAYRQAKGWFRLINENLEDCETETRKLVQSWGFPDERYDKKAYKMQLELENELERLPSNRNVGRCGNSFD